MEGADSIVELYRRHARVWALARRHELVEQTWMDRFLGLLPASGRILDIGCGSGIPMARYLVERGHPVTGVDSSPEMIELFRQGLPDQTAWVADMRTMELGERFWGLLAWNSFFHLAHEAQRQMFGRFAEHAAPGAALLFTSGPGYGEAIGTLEGEPLYHASLEEAEYRQLLEQNGFRVVAHTREDPNCNHHTVWLAQSGS